MSVSKIFGENVFNLSTMRERLPKATVKSLEKTIKDGTPLDLSVAEVVANAMKDWAIEKGATHYTHWFQPMTGVTAEKHDAFISPAEDGKVIMEFSGKNLVKGEADASSFPSGGIRATFEARGYTAWDPTSFAFIKDGTLCVPTAFCSFSGEVLDKKTPLMRSVEVLSKESLRILKHFGSDATRIESYVGAEQEYFLVDKELYEQRKDLMLTGRTLFGCKPAKGQELDDHYYGVIKERVSAYMKELDKELWKLGVLAKTKHNEVAPAQHELAPVYDTTNIATDHNQLTMEMMKRIAQRQGLVCLLHEKPYDGINGSGKHNNWSLGTNLGENLLKPGKDPLHNRRFLLFLSAVIKAVDTYGDLLRMTIATAGNDHRLGANEAPPAIVSMFLGDDLTAVLDSIKNGTDSYDSVKGVIETGVLSLPSIKRDTSDRNRTSPFAFTGNKFEFRMPGSSQSVADINIVLNTIVADALADFADALETAADPMAKIDQLIRETITNHGRIIFNGNSYSDEWHEEAKKRGLPILPTTVDALPVFITDKVKKLFTRHGVFTEIEVESRYEILLESYIKTINIEALTTLEMAKQEILPACLSYTDSVVASVAMKDSIGIKAPATMALATKLSDGTEKLLAAIDALDAVMAFVPQAIELETANYYKDKVLPAMDAVRAAADSMETIVARDYWPFPTYTDLLYRV
ncbi:MAG: glutamine synthetase III [Eubacteriales bacterium]|nr:glutamine synthetase III [Eubacteriales bacterium]